ncbi:hypothetical protein [Comamonas serinivorans]|nr:hypothetical protein [Comamonas serinivorans]
MRVAIRGFVQQHLPPALRDLGLWGPAREQLVAWGGQGWTVSG